MATDTCECGTPTRKFRLEEPFDYERRRAYSTCPGCGRRYAFVLPTDLSRTVLPPTVIKTHMEKTHTEGDVIVVDHWRDAQGEVRG